MKALKNFWLHSDFWTRLGVLLSIFWVGVAVVSAFWTPYNINSNYDPIVRPFGYGKDGAFFLLGTDSLGRDILSRLMVGCRNVIVYATSATTVAYMVGIMMGLVGGYFRGKIDSVMSWGANMILSFPVVVLYILIASTFESSGYSIFFAVVFASSPGIFRIVRGLTMDICTRDYIYASQTRGESLWYLLLVDILPNVRGPLIVDFCLRIGYTTIQLGFLAFIGLGLSKQNPDWGQMIRDYLSEIIGNYYMILSPSIALVLLVLGINLLADGIREYSIKD